MKIKDLTGQKFGRLTVIARNGRNQHGHVMWLCRCDCGNETVVSGSNLKKGNTKSCGCWGVESRFENYRDLTGEQFGRLFVIGKSLQKQGKHIMWECWCDCGNFTTVLATNLVTGNTQSCGCMLQEAYIEGQNVKHGMARKGRETREYNSWISMKQRCYNPKNKFYKHYGGRGIRVCDRWLESFENFYEDMGPCPLDKNSIGRKDNDGHYEPNNCGWEDDLEQANNKQNSIWLTFRDETRTIPQWARKLNMSQDLIRNRYYAGWPVERILTVK